MPVRPPSAPRESTATEPIAIVGIGCRLPGGVRSPQGFWELLREGRDAIGEVPASRWDLARHYDPDPLRPLHQHVRHGGFLDDIDQFDAAFFGVSPREAACMDPQQRLLLEVAWRALEDAGQPADELRGQPVGVVVGISSADYSSLLWASSQGYAVPDNEPFLLPGNTGCIAANRLSYAFDLRGPSFTVDTACSSSLVAVHLACESLWRGEAAAALAGGVQALIHPGIQASFCKAGLLSPEGRCKSFDASADGYVRSEGAGVVLLRPLAEARRRGDRIYALIHGTAVNSDGRSNGLAAPNLRAQIACVREAFARAGLDPAAAQYVEAHGTGTRQGDPIELRALGTVLGEGRPADRPCRVGSVKTNLGHGETAAGITGLIKAALCVHHRQLPPSLHCRTPNPAVDFAGLKLQVQTRLEPFPAPELPAVVGVSSFGFGGTNAHVVLAEAPPQPPQPPGPQLPLQLFTLSARSPAVLRASAAAHAALLRRQPQLALADVCATANRSRSPFRQRLVALAADGPELAGQLEAFAAGEAAAAGPGLLQGEAPRRPGRLAFLFTGQGSQALAMAQGLYRHHPVFRAAVDRVAALAADVLELPLPALLLPAPDQERAAAAALQQTAGSQPALFAVGYGLSQLWLSWGIVPDLLLGHSVGEVVAAHLAGVFDLADAVRLVTARGRLMQELPADGAMVALPIDAAAARAWLAEAGGADLQVAAENGPGNTVVAGPEAAVLGLMEQALARGIACRRLAVSHAFHTPAMAPMLPAYARVLAQLRFSPPARPLVSGVSGQLVGAEVADPDYWCAQVIRPVRFAAGVATLAAEGCRMFLELGARPTLIGLARQCLGPGASAAVKEPLQFLPSLVPGQDDWSVILRSLGALHLAGHPVDWRGFHGPFPHRRVALPGYPFERRRHWWSRADEGPVPASLWSDHLGISQAGAPPAADPPAATPPSPVLGDRLERLDLPGQALHYGLALDPGGELQDHRIRGQVIAPAAGWLLLALELLARERRPLRLGPLQLDRPLRLGEEPVRLQLLLEGERISFHSRAPGRTAAAGALPAGEPEPGWLCHGQLQLGARGVAVEAPLALEPPPPGAALLPLDRFYEALAGCGLEYGRRYRALVALRAEGERAWAELERPAGASAWGLLDGCFQAVAATLDPEAMAGQLVLPVGLEAMELEPAGPGWPGLPDRLGCQVRLLASPEPTEVRAHLLLHDGERPLGWIRGFRLRRLPRQAMEWLFPAPQRDATHPGRGPETWLLHSVWWPLVEGGEAAEAGEAGEAAEPEAQPPEAPLLVGAGPHQALGFEAWLQPLGRVPRRLPFDAPLPAGTGPVLVWPELASAEPGRLCAGLLAIAQGLAAAPEPRPVWLVLEGEGAAAGALDGLARTLALESPGQGWGRLHLPASAAEQPGPTEWPGLWARLQGAPALRWRHGHLAAPRLERLPAERLQLLSHDPGRLEALALEPLAPFALLPGEVELAVEATGLNFRDVLNALGLLEAYGAQLGLETGARLPFGGECVGRVVALGPGVDPALLGQRVVAALAVGSLASHVACRAQLCAPLPEGLDASEAAGLSTAFLTALYGLDTLAQLQPGETVLIHAAAGGVGQAALQVARRRGARILATASAAKQAALLEQGVEAVFDSRSLAFADRVLAHTDGRGVDVVLNSLKGPWVEASFRALAPGGRFLELGKIEIWSRAEAAERRPDARYLPFDLLEVATAEPALLRELLLQLLADRVAGHVQPLPLRVFPIARAQEAFRLMAQARHVGKVVIRQPERPAPLRIRPDATYLVSGALGGIGLRLLPWLADQGARSLVLVGRSADRPDAQGRLLLEQLAERGVSCIRLALDLGAAGAAAALAEERLAAALAALPPERPLRGVIHAAGVRDDGLIGGLTPERLEAVLAPKLAGWQRIEAAIARASPAEVSPPASGSAVSPAAAGPAALGRLDFLLAFSSLAALLGSPGQAAYGAANGALEGLCRQATDAADGPAAAAPGVAASGPVRLAIQWGPWAGAGMAADPRLTRRFAAMGVGVLDPEAALGALEALLRRGGGGVVAVLDNDWARLAAQASPRQRPLFAALVPPLAPPGATEHADAGDAGPALRRQLAAVAPAERRRLVLELLQRRLAQVMGLAEDQTIDPADSLYQLGLDSLMAVEFAAGLQADLGMRLELEALAGDPCLDALADLLAAELAAEASGDGGLAGGLDLGAQAQLAPDWRRPCGPAVEPPGAAVLLTGATGFLGAYLLAGQLRRWPDLELRCLVRCGTPAEGLERLRANLARYDLWREEDAPRLTVVPGDLAQPRFGLDPAAFAALAEGLGGILHNGAQLSQMASYGQLAAANVGGTRTALELATLDRPLPLQLISSVAVFEADACRDREILETDDLPEWRGIQLGYSQTKWVSERLVLQAGRAGLPVTVYRPPLIGGHSRSGAWHQDDLLHRLLRGCLALGLAPAVPWPLDLVPVDYVADAVTALAWSPAATGRCFHLHHPQPAMLADLLTRLIAAGTRLELVPMDRWLEAIEADPANPLHPLRAFFLRRWGDDQLTYPERNQLGVRARPSARATVAALEPLGVRCPSFEDLLGPYGRELLPDPPAPQS